MTLQALLMRALMIVVMAAGALANAKAAHDPCPLTSKNREWSATCFDETKVGRQIKTQFRKSVVLDKEGYAAIVIKSPAELVIVNRQSNVVRLTKAHLAAFTFEPSDNTVARFSYLGPNAEKTGESKCGYYRRGGRFKVLVPPVYDQCDQFDEGKAVVCIGCTNYCESGDCHETEFIGGEGIVINATNKVLKRFALPSLPRCGDDNPKATASGKCHR